MNRYNLLPENHPTVLRRLVRELNHRPDGFYYAKLRWTSARFHDEKIQLSRDGKTFVNAFTSAFSDGNGNDICASRKAVAK